MIELLKLHHVSLAIRDLEASKLFYGGILGLPEIERPGFRFPGAWYALGDRQMHLIQESSGARESAERLSRSDHIALEVADVDAVRERLSAQGVEFNEGGNQALGMDQIFCLDPDGHVIEFVSYGTK
jgi:catechol 2,3-dioxygenase-like lactoylglutathione lyase family enzyme